ncbi:MAG: SH3 domain-containing protein [Eubacterium sp.]
MKKTKLIVLIASTILLLSSCTSSTAKKAIEEGKLSMANSDYTAALNYFQLAKNEGCTDSELDEMILIVEKYTEAEKAFNEIDMDGTREALEAIPESYKNYSIASDIDVLQEQLNTKSAIMSDIDSQISGTKKMIADGDYESAAANIKELYSKDITNYQRTQIDQLKTTIESAQEKIDEASSQKEVVYVAPNPPKNPVPATSSNTNVVATYYVVNCKQSITLRTSPSTSASEITQIPLGQAVGYIENAGNGFYKINYDGAVGYSLASYLSPTKQSSGSSSSGSTAQVVNAKEYITLRSAPSTSASEITKIPAGAYVKYLGNASNGFYHIEYNGMTGYGLQSYLEIK